MSPTPKQSKPPLGSWVPQSVWEKSSLRWLYLDLNSYFASVEQQEQPHLRGRPVAVVPVMTDTTSAIAASYEAKAFGIRTGTPIWEAKQRCPGILLVPARHDLYVEYHHKILDAIDKHIPVAKIGSIDEVACELLGRERLREEALALAKRLKQALREDVGDCIRCSIGIAPNGFLAKVASDMQKPDGLVLIDAADLPGPLFKLKLRDLPGIGANMERRLADAGIVTVRELWEAGPEECRRIWGSIGGAQFWHKLRGEQVADPKHGRHSLSHSHVLPPKLRGLDEAEAVARRLTTKLGTRLRRIGFMAPLLYLSLRFADGAEEKWSRDFRLTETQDSFVLLDGLSRLWAMMRTEVAPHRRVRKVGVALGNIIPERETTGDLFGGGSGFEPKQERPEQRVALAKALDELNARYGRDTVHIGALPGQTKANEFMGSKIAFNRIPDKAEFKE